MKVTYELEATASSIVKAGFKVQKELGPGLMERVYEICLEHELRKAGHKVERQVPVPIIYDGIVFEEGFRLDMLVDEQVVIEIKAKENSNPLWQAQIISYLKLSGKKLGFLINFNVPLFRDGIKRFIN